MKHAQGECVLTLHVKLQSCCGTSSCATAADRNLALVKVCRVITQKAERNTGSCAEAETGSESLQSAEVIRTALIDRVAEENIGGGAAVGAQIAGPELVAQQVQLAGGEVK